MATDLYIDKGGFRVWLPDVEFVKSEDEDAFNSRRIRGIMSTSSEDRQSERVLAKGLDFNPFLQYGHFNDNHSQSTSAVVGYPESAYYSKEIKKGGKSIEGWLTEGYVIKGTKRADDIWELAKALAGTPDRRLGFSIEGKVLRRSNNVIEKALIRNVAITNCPVNTECTWSTLAKSFWDEDTAMKSLTAGYGAAGGPATQTGGSALGVESLEKDDEKRNKKKDAALKEVMRSIGYDLNEISKAFDYLYDLRPDFSDEAAVLFVQHLISKGR